MGRACDDSDWVWLWGAPRQGRPAYLRDVGGRSAGAHEGAGICPPSRFVAASVNVLVDG
jgi:hypothetical protein